MSEHTPGPWKAAGKNPDGYGIVSHGEPECLLAEVHAPGRPSSREFWEELQANTRLIAAGPDLLAACEAALHLVEADRNGFSRETEILKQITAAIAKARGKTATAEPLEPFQS